MSIEAQCPGCGKASEVPERFVGKRVRCPDCSTQFQVTPARSPAPLKPVPISESKPQTGTALKPIPLSRSKRPDAPAQSGDPFDFEGAPATAEVRRPRRDAVEEDDRDDRAFHGRGERKNLGVWIGAGATVIVALVVVIIVFLVRNDDSGSDGINRSARKKSTDQPGTAREKDELKLPEKEVGTGKTDPIAGETLPKKDETPSTKKDAGNSAIVDVRPKPPMLDLPKNPADKKDSPEGTSTQPPAVKNVGKRGGLVILEIGGEASLLVKIDRELIKGDVVLGMRDLPKGVSVSPVKVAKDAPSGTLLIRASDNAQGQIAIATLVVQSARLILKQDVELSVRQPVKPRGEVPPR